jgi:predicted phage terminase large subunit-like protein
VDDADTKERCKNKERVLEAVNWVKEDLIGALGLTSGARIIIAGNRINKQSIIAHMVGDVELKDPKHEGVQHIKVFAIENPKTHAKAEIDDPLSKPAWKERYTKDHLRKRFKIIGYRATRREYFHEHVEEGNVFLHEWIQWAKSPKLEEFDRLVCYTDPSFTNNRNSDFKAIVLLGTYRHKVTNQYRYHIRKTWVRQASIMAMVKAKYEIYYWVGDFATYWIESNMLQKPLIDAFYTEGSIKKNYMPISGDSSKKADKFTRIENMSPIFEQGIIEFAEDQRDDVDMITFIEQLTLFPTGHDDAPDALQGAYSKLRVDVAETPPPRTGKFKRSSSRV